MAKKKLPADGAMAETIKQAMRDTGQSVNGIAKASGISQPILQRFMAGERGLTLVTADKLCRFLGLELRLLRERT